MASNNDVIDNDVMIGKGSQLLVSGQPRVGSCRHCASAERPEELHYDFHAHNWHDSRN